MNQPVKIRFFGLWLYTRRCLFYWRPMVGAYKRLVWLDWLGVYVSVGR